MKNHVLALGLISVFSFWVSAQDVPNVKRIVTEKPVTKISPFKLGTVTVSQDGRRFAFARQVGSGFNVEVDGKAEAAYKDVGPVNPDIVKTSLGSLIGIKPMIFSADSKHLAYGARQGDDWIIVLDGKQSRPFKNVGGPVLSADGQHLAFRAQTALGWRVVADENEGRTYEKVGPPVFSPDGKHVAYAARAGGKEMMVADGVQGKPYDSLDNIPEFLVQIALPYMVAAAPRFSSDGRLAYVAKKAGKWHLVLEGQESEAFESVADSMFGLIFSPDGKRLAFSAKKAGMWSLFVDDLAHGSSKQQITTWIFSPDSQHFAFVAKSEGKVSVFVDDRSVGTYDEVGVPVFSPDSARIAYAVKSGKMWALAVDGVLQKPYPAVLTPVFSPDGSHLAYEALLPSQRWVVVIDGVEGSPNQGLVQGASIVFDDNSHLHYLAVKSQQLLLIEEEISTDPASLNYESHIK